MSWWNTVKTFVTNTVSAIVTSFAKIISPMMNPVVLIALLVTVGALVAIGVVASYISKETERSKLSNTTGSGDAFHLHKYGDFSYHASTERDNMHICNGALITENFVLTVAEPLHTYVNNQEIQSEMKVRVDVLNLEAYKNIWTVEGITVHPKFEIRRLAHNVALLKIKLQGNFTSMRVPRPINLPRLETNTRNIEATKILVSDFKEPLRRNKTGALTGINMTITQREICILNFLKKIEISGKFCAVSLPQWKACQTDVGGPVVNADGTLVGLFAMKNPLDCSKKLPEIFVACLQVPRFHQHNN